ncbi:MAG: DUF4129 domain-containing protein [Lachnospiraceae bacterium]|nr:DUF4129 domain-containing protein [Lachnospiraceae bacterium]
MIIYYLKDLSIMLFYCMIIRTNAIAFPNSINLVAAALIMSLGPVMSKILYDHYSVNLRFIGLFPVFLAFMASPITVANVLLLVPGAIYMIVLIVKIHKETEYYSYVEFFTVLIIAGLLFLVMYTAMNWQVNQSATLLFKRSFDDCIAGGKYFVVFFLTGVIVARNLRVKEKPSLGSVKNFGVLALSILAVSALAIGYEKISGIVIKGLRVLVLIVLMPLGYLSDGWTRFGHKMGEIVETSSGNPLLRGNMIEYFASEWSGIDVVPLTQEKIRADLQADKGYFIVSIILFLIVAIVGAKVLTSRKRKDNRDEFVRAKLAEHEVIKIRRLLTNRERVRSVYRRFISIMKARGIVITDNMTSEEILNLLTGLMNYDSAVALRNIYIKARYNDTGEIDASEIKAAREALRKLTI